MKSIDLGHLGGYPLCQSDLLYLQNEWTEAILALAVAGGNAANTAYVLSGMASSTIGGTTTVTAGWFVYNGELIRFPGGTYSTPVAGGHAIYVVITPTSVPHSLPFNDASTPNVINDVTGVITVLVNTTPVDATHFLLSAIVPWVIIDQTLYDYIAAIDTVITSAWAAVGAPGLIVSGGGTFSGGTVTYNSAKYINANCVAWQLTLSGYTVAGTVNSIEIALPGYVSIGGGGWANPGSIYTGTLHYGGPLYTVRGVTTNPGAVPKLILTFEYAVFPAGVVNALNITVVGEVE